MDVKILGTGCASCQSMYNDVNRIIARNDWQGDQSGIRTGHSAHHVLRRDGHTGTRHQREGGDDRPPRHDENRARASTGIRLRIYSASLSIKIQLLGTGCHNFNSALIVCMFSGFPAVAGCLRMIVA